MQVFKFGGASIQNAEAIKNVASILSSNSNQNLVVVISALGKTTNALEKLWGAYLQTDSSMYNLFNEIKLSHKIICDELLFQDDELVELNVQFNELEKFISTPPSKAADYYYDQIISFGELFSTKIVSTYLSKQGLNPVWLDARQLIRTDDNYRDVNILWQETEKLILEKVIETFKKTNLIITQGFIGSTTNGHTTTLGREGSDYSASIFSYCLHAEKMTIWKDVDGVMNCDPKLFSDAVIIPVLSYHEAIEMTFYGAKVIHPKTIKPIQNKHIPLQVRSFINKNNPGTIISTDEVSSFLPPVIVWKPNQVLISMQAKDFSFIGEKHLHQIFKLFAHYRIRMNLTQNGAISFSACVDNSGHRVEELCADLQKEFKVLRNENLELLTIRHYNQPTIDRLQAGRKLLIEQKTRNTIQFVLE